MLAAGEGVAIAMMFFKSSATIVCTSDVCWGAKRSISRGMKFWDDNHCFRRL